MNRRGFTMIEVVITMIVAGLLALLSFPTLSGAMSQRSAWNARAIAISLYARARANASETGRATSLSWNGDVALITAWPRLTVGGSGTVDTIGAPQNFNTLYGVRVTGNPGPALTIDPRGLGTSASTTVFFTRNGNRDSVIVTGYGRVVK